MPLPSPTPSASPSPTLTPLIPTSTPTLALWVISSVSEAKTVSLLTARPSSATFALKPSMPDGIFLIVSFQIDTRVPDKALNVQDISTNVDGTHFFSPFCFPDVFGDFNGTYPAGLILDFRNFTLTYPSPTLSGKILVWDFDENQEAKNVETIFPSQDIVAQSTADKITVFAVVEKTSTVVGHYSPSGGAAYQVYWDIIVLHYPEKELVGRHTVIGSYPPTSIYGYAASGDIYRPTAEWILGLPNSTLSPSTTPTPQPTPSPTPTQSPSPSPSPNSINMLDAVKQGLVSVSVYGRSLQEIRLTLTSNSQNRLIVTLKEGTIFGSSSSSVQNMVALSSDVFSLAPSERISQIIAVACSSMQLEQPDSADTFSITAVPASGDLGRLLSLAAFQSETFRVKQFAIWTITDNPTRYGYTQIGIAGNYSVPTDAEMQRILALFTAAGITPNSYRALSGLTSPTSTPG
jgi:hypothetical protein